MSNEYEYVYIIIIVLLFVLLRTRSQIRGRKTGTRQIFMRPVLYGFLTLLLLTITPNVMVLLFALLFAVIGYLVGTKLGIKSKVFEKDGVVRSKGSNEVFFIWIGAFILRLLIEVALPLPTSSSASVLLSNYTNPASAYFWYMIVDLLLAFSAGMLLGEARHIYRMYKSVKGNSKTQSQVS